MRKPIENYTRRLTEKLLLPPLYGYTKDGMLPYKPNIVEVFCEWIDMVNFLRDKKKILPAIYALFTIFTLFLIFIYFKFYFTISSFVFVVIAVAILGTIYNTVWYHRYCCHNSFEFNRQIYQKIFLWANPSVFREESYVLPHRVHHMKSDRVGDPYGPHLGWLGSFLATESSQRTNVDLTREEFNLILKSLKHVGFEASTYEQFKRTGSFENIVFYALRTFSAHLFWSAVFFCIGGKSYVVAWYCALGVYTFLLRDFNWRGHGGNFRKVKKDGWEYSKTRALNQHFYGIIAGEWHDNHHNYPMSANNSFLKGQPDLAFLLIKTMHYFGIVKSYIDAAPKFRLSLICSNRGN